MLPKPMPVNRRSVTWFGTIDTDYYSTKLICQEQAEGEGVGGFTSNYSLLPTSNNALLGKIKRRSKEDQGHYSAFDGNPGHHSIISGTLSFIHSFIHSWTGYLVLGLEVPSSTHEM